MIRLGIDVGGTFTDGVIIDEETGGILHAKVASTPEDPLTGLVGVIAKLGLTKDAAQIFVHGTTLVTNLILQRTGCRVALITTRGFRDVLEIQRTYRAEPMDVLWVKAKPLVPRDLRAEVSERTLADGSVEAEPDMQETLEQARGLVEAGAEAIAVCLLNSYANPANERQVGEWIGSAFPGVPVSLSSDVDPQVREYERASTTVINAYAIPEVHSYLKALSETVRPDVLLMHSGGGVLAAPAVAKRPVKLVQSGPAGGVIAAREVGRIMGWQNLITFDMGGTSTDVSAIVGGQVERAPETEITWGIPLRAESLEIRSIGAGGGSIASRDAGEVLKVGPQSAGAFPGPACYGSGGSSPTVTDANLVLNLIHPDRFLGGDMALDVEAARKAVDGLAEGFGVSRENLAVGIHQMVNANMAQLIREMTVHKGRDPREFTLVSFGGAGGQHAYGVAQTVGCRQVLFPRHASAFSALGLVLAAVETTEAQSYSFELDSGGSLQLEGVFEQLDNRAKQHFPEGEDLSLTTRRHVMIRYRGQTHEVAVEVSPEDDARSLYDRFEATHETLFGTRLGDPAEVVSIHTTLSLDSHRLGEQLGSAATELGRLESTDERWIPLFEAPATVYMGGPFRPDVAISGPALIEEKDTVVVVPPGAELRFEPRADLYTLTLPKTEDR